MPDVGSDQNYLAVQVSGSQKRKLEKREQRLAPRARRLGALYAAFPAAETRSLRLTFGSVGRSSMPGNDGAETALRGWPYGTRTSMCREKIHLFGTARGFAFKRLGGDGCGPRGE